MTEDLQDAKKANRARIALVASVAITIVLYYVPGGRLLARPLLLISTLIHEMGHGFAAILAGGSFDSFVMFWDGSGQAITSIPRTRFAAALVPMGGLIGPAVFGGFLMAIGRKEKLNKVMLIIIGLVFLIAEVLVVRNLFGWAFIGLFGLICLVVGLRASPNLCQWFSYFIGVQLALSVFSRADYLFTNVAVTAIGNSPSDVQLMADALFLPYWVWGIICGGISVLCLGIGLWAVFRK